MISLLAGLALAMANGPFKETRIELEPGSTATIQANTEAQVFCKGKGGGAPNCYVTELQNSGNYGYAITQAGAAAPLFTTGWFSYQDNAFTIMKAKWAELKTLGFCAN